MWKKMRENHAKCVKFNLNERNLRKSEKDLNIEYDLQQKHPEGLQLY